jgi:rSAM/selenodomain-associated transferase 2
MNPKAPFVSVIVPVLNEARLIGDFLRHVQTLGPGIEIVVVDGGSSDETQLIARTLADRVISGPRGRAAQMNAGAEIARAEVFWFLHADSTAPPNAIQEISAALSDSRNAGGCFRVQYPRREWIYRVCDSLGNVGVNAFGFALGDHGIFCRRSAFRQVGGYPIVPILEDAELYLRLRAVGRMKQLREKIVSDPRTFERSGRYRTIAVYFVILALYVVGVPISRLNKIYRSFFASRPSHGGRDCLGGNPAERAGEAEFG